MKPFPRRALPKSIQPFPFLGRLTGIVVMLFVIPIHMIQAMAEAFPDAWTEACLAFRCAFGPWEE